MLTGYSYGAATIGPLFPTRQQHAESGHCLDLGGDHLFVNVDGEVVIDKRVKAGKVLPDRRVCHFLHAVAVAGLHRALDLRAGDDFAQGAVTAVVKRGANGAGMNLLLMLVPGSSRVESAFVFGRTAYKILPKRFGRWIL